MVLRVLNVSFVLPMMGCMVCYPWVDLCQECFFPRTRTAEVCGHLTSRQVEATRLIKLKKVEHDRTGSTGGRDAQNLRRRLPLAQRHFVADGQRMRVHCSSPSRLNSSVLEVDFHHFQQSLCGLLARNQSPSEAPLVVCYAWTTTYMKNQYKRKGVFCWWWRSARNSIDE